jgi:hypothetical protein
VSKLDWWINIKIRFNHIYKNAKNMRNYTVATERKVREQSTDVKNIKDNA